jgi:hypothetical protein
LGSFEIQVIVSLVVVLGAACVALICDYLKGNNERLRERNEELQARASEREMLETLLQRFQANTFDAAMQVQKEALRDLLANSTPAQRVLPQSGVSALPEARAVGASQAIAASPRRVVAKQRVLESATSKDVLNPVIEWPVPTVETKDRRVSPVEYEKDRRALSAITTEYAPANRQPAAPDNGLSDLTTPDETVSHAPGRSWEQMTQEAAQARAAHHAPALAPAMEAPLATQPTIRVFQMQSVPDDAAASPDRAESQPEVPAPAVPSFPIAELLVPTGHFEVQGLQDLLAAKGAFRGLVVFISVLANGELAPMECPQFTRLLNSAARTVLSLRREVDFSCRSAENEFVLIYPHETGPTAQRIIARLKERLYDLQLRSLGSFSARFNWGAAESAADARLSDLLGQARGQAQDFLKAQDAASSREAATR